MNSSSSARFLTRLPLLAATAAAVLAGLVLGPPAARATTTSTASTAVTAAAGAFAPIRNVGTGLCVQARGNFESDLVQLPCNGSTPQNWIFVPNRNGNHVVNQVTGLCAYMNGPVAGGSPNIQTNCTDVTNEDWKVVAPPAVTTIMSRAGRRDTNLCLTPESSSPGALLKIFTCNGASNQLWVIGV